MRISLFAFSFVLPVCLILFGTGMGCQSEPASSEQQISPPSQLDTAGLDISRTNAVHNTPSRDANGRAVQEAPKQQEQDSGPLLTAVPAELEVPEEMVFIPGGEMEMGSDRGLPREQPVMTRHIQGFLMDRHPVTVAQFRAFVEATGYKTEAEKFGNSGVFDLTQQAWYLHEGASWAYPMGPENAPAPEDHPVTQVSWHDASAYASWAGKRLPQETEWEHAARNGRNSRTQYAWGEEIKRQGLYHANIWQGVFPAKNTGEDGYLFTSPVGAFNTNDLGLQDMSGNVWEWCADWYRSYGPNSRLLYDNQGAGEKERVMRGGSFMCDPSYCHGYRVSGRSGSTPETGLFHVGFRCVKSIGG